MVSNVKLREAREMRQWTQAKVAGKIGVDEKTVSRWERGLSYPQPYVGHKLVALFDMSLEDLGLVGRSSEAIRSVEVKQEEAVEQVAQTDPANIQEVAASQLAIINSYYQSGLEQSQQSFRWSLIWGGIGFGFLILAVGVLLFQGSLSVAIVSGVAGALVEAFAGIYLYLYKHASDQLAAFRASLEETQRLLLANSMCEKLKGDLEQSTRADIIQLVVRAVVHIQELAPPKENRE